MAQFDFHRRRLQLRLRLLGSEPAAARGVLRRWRAAAHVRGGDPDTLCLPAVPLADLTGFDLEVRAEAEGGAGGWEGGADACLLVVDGGVPAVADLQRLERRARDGSESGLFLWTSATGWSQALAEAARELGIADDVLLEKADSREGALSCLEVAMACLLDQAMMQIQPAAPGDAAPDAAALAQRVRCWARSLREAGMRTLASAGRSRPAARIPVAADEPWRRRAFDLQGIDPLPADDAAREIDALDHILRFAPPLLEGAAQPAQQKNWQGR